MAISFTQGNDFIIPTENDQTYLGGGGDDTYILSTTTVAAGATIVIQDTEGANRIQLVDGLEITSSSVYNDAVELTLSNGAKVQITGASNFGYEVGANITAGDSAASQTYDDFVTGTLLTTRPAEGEPASTGGTVVVPDSSTPAAPTFSVTASEATVTEGGTATFTVELSAAQATATTVAYALAGTGGAVLGTDTTAVADATLTFEPGQTTKTITVPVTFDTDAETGEGMTLTLSSPSTGTELGTSSAAVAFADPVAPTFTMTSNAVAGAATEEGQTITYTITPDSVTDKAYTFTLSTLGDTVGGVATAASAADFSPASQTVTFAAGTTTAQTVTQTIVNDGTTEGLEGYKTSLLDSTFTAISTTTGLITDPTSGSGTGTTYNFTNDIDAFSGTSGNDTFASANGFTDGVATTASTFSAADSVTDSGGTGDKLTLTYEGDFKADVDITAAAATISGVETITVRNLMTTDGDGDTITYDAANAAGHTTVASDRSTAAVAFTNVADGATIGIIGNGAATGNVTATYKSATSAVKVEVSGGTKTSTFTNAGTTTATTATVSSTGSVANSLGNMDFGSATLLKDLTINATARFLTTDLGDATDDFAADAKLTVAGSAANSSTGTQAVTVGTLDSNITTIDASGLTAGGLSATLGTGVTSLKGGTGNDNITAATLATPSLQAIDAGAGTGDILTVAASANVNTLTLGKAYANFEVLQVADGVSVDVENLATYNTVNALRMTDGGEFTNVTATQAADVTITTGGNSPTISIKDATVSGNIDTLKLAIDDGSATTASTIALATPVLAGLEILEMNVATGDTGTITLLTSAPQLTNINLTGAGATSITSGALSLQTNFKIDASNGTGANTVNFTLADTNGFRYDGNAKIDTVTLGVRGDNTINTGDGKDDITAVAKTGGTGGDVITMGAGADSFDFGAQVGNDADSKTTFKFVSTDSKIVSSATNGYSADNMDNILGIHSDANAATDAGNMFYIDTDVKATAVTATTTAVTFGSTTVTNAFDFYVYAPASGTVAYVYQDTDGDKVIEDGEFGIQLTGVDGKWTPGEFTMNGTTGDLTYTSVV